VAIRKYGVATPLLPNVFGALLLGDLKGYVNARGSIFLHPGQNMAVEVEHNPDAGVSNRSLATFGCIPASQHVRRMTAA